MLMPRLNQTTESQTCFTHASVFSKSLPPNGFKTRGENYQNLGDDPIHVHMCRDLLREPKCIIFGRGQMNRSQLWLRSSIMK